MEQVPKWMLVSHSSSNSVVVSTWATSPHTCRVINQFNQFKDFTARSGIFQNILYFPSLIFFLFGKIKCVCVHTYIHMYQIIHPIAYLTLCQEPKATTSTFNISRLLLLLLFHVQLMCWSVLKRKWSVHISPKRTFVQKYELKTPHFASYVLWSHFILDTMFKQDVWLWKFVK
jgi:hypothetical protein